MSRARAILLACYFPRSVALEGVGSLLKGLSAHLAAGGDDVRLLVPEGSYDATPGVKLLTYSSGLLGLPRYRQALRRHSKDADAVLMFENNPNMVGSADASLQRENTLCYFYTPLQDFGLLRQAPFTRQALVHSLSKHKILARFRDWSRRRCLVGSEFQARQLRKLGATEVHVLPVCGLSRQAPVPARSQARAALGWDDRPVVGYLGHCSYAKGVDVLVEAFAGSQGPAKLALAYSGKGRLKSSSYKLLDALRTTGRIIEMGVVNPLNFLAACDVIALPYVTSSIFHQPQVLLESFAASTAVITTDLGGFGEMVQNGRTGLVVPARQPGSLAVAIQQASSNLEQAHAMGRAARELFERQGCVESFVQWLGRPVR